MTAPFFSYVLESRLAFVAIFFIVLLAFLEVGLRIGRARRARNGEKADEGATLVVGSILGLLAFVLALNLSNASSRFDRRINATLEEVNAIGTALMQASAIAEGGSDGIAAKLKTYLEIRHAYAGASREPGELARIAAETQKLQGEIWAQLSSLVAERPAPDVVSLMNAINAAFDSSTAMQLAMEYRMPEQVIWLLLVMSGLGIAAVGYQFGLTGRRGRGPGIVLSVLWCVIVTEIMDIGSARIWTFRTDTRIYEWALDGLENPAAAED